MHLMISHILHVCLIMHFNDLVDNNLYFVDQFDKWEIYKLLPGNQPLKLACDPSARSFLVKNWSSKNY